MQRAGRWLWPLETVSLHDPRAAPLPAAGGPAAFPFGRNGGSWARFQWRGRRELVSCPSVTPCTGEASRRLRSCRCCPGHPADAPQAPSGHPRYPQTPRRYPTETRGRPVDTPQKPADTPQMTCRRPMDTPQTPRGHPTETRRHPADDSQAPRGRRGCSCRQPSGRPSRATQGDGLCRPLLSLPDQLGKRVRQTTWCLNKV